MSHVHSFTSGFEAGFGDTTKIAPLKLGHPSQTKKAVLPNTTNQTENGSFSQWADLHFDYSAPFPGLSFRDGLYADRIAEIISFLSETTLQEKDGTETVIPPSTPRQNPPVSTLSPHTPEPVGVSIASSLPSLPTLTPSTLSTLTSLPTLSAPNQSVLSSLPPLTPSTLSALTTNASSLSYQTGTTTSFVPSTLTPSPSPPPTPPRARARPPSAKNKAANRLAPNPASQSEISTHSEPTAVHPHDAQFPCAWGGRDICVHTIGSTENAVHTHLVRFHLPPYAFLPGAKRDTRAVTCLWDGRRTADNTHVDTSVSNGGANWACGKKMQRSSLATHIAATHLHSMAHRCALCARTFAQRQTAMRHEKTRRIRGVCPTARRGRVSYGPNGRISGVGKRLGMQ